MATFIVNTRADENDPVGSGGNLSLREAINEANSTPEDDIITFDSSLSGIISLTSGQLVITSNISIEGNGSNITVDAGGRSRGVHLIFVKKEGKCRKCWKCGDFRQGGQCRQCDNFIRIFV